MIGRIISGGQTGVDRAALDAALAMEFPCGGWCPRGRLAEDGPIPERYPLAETETAEYTERTERNVFDSDGTLVLTRGEPTGGTAYTIGCAEAHGRPYLLLDYDVEADPAIVIEWAQTYEIQVLNVAGPRESTLPGVYQDTRQFIREVLAAISQDHA